MSNYLTEDYFSFMSSKWETNRSKPRASVVTTPLVSATPSDTIDFVEEPQMEVTESFVSETMIQRLFKRRSDD